MATDAKTNLSELYLEDETAWLDITAELVAERRLAELDCDNLQEFLESMAKRDRREVRRRMVILLFHLLKWEHQPEKRTRSWVRTILTQRRELRSQLDSATLRRHAADVLAKAYADAREDAAAETGLPLATFPATTALTIDLLIAKDADDALLN